MKVKLGQAVKKFFGNSSFEMVYFEAIANSLDAGSNAIDICITAKAYNQPETIEVRISDNGEGFTEERYRKFSNLFDVDEDSHKGLGRLIFLCYFDKIDVISYFEQTKKREFCFTESFDEKDSKTTKVEPNIGTTFKMSGYTLSKLRSNTFIQPIYLKQKILEEFYSRLFQLKKKGQEIRISITAEIDDRKIVEVLTNDDIPVFEVVELDCQISLIDKFFLHYSIEEVPPSQTSLIAAVSVDNRTVKVDIIADENKPDGYRMVFLLYSDWFIGKVDSSRQSLVIPDIDLQKIHYHFRKKVASIIEEKIPQVKDRNRETSNNLVNRFPHLAGYFNAETIGYISKADVLKKAQEQFFKAQKELLEANQLTDEQYEKSLEFSARALTEYILFRQMTIEKLKKTSRANSEAELHRLFATMKTQFHKANIENDLYRNNAWLLDDKYMTYETVLSDVEMGNLIEFITSDDQMPRDDNRPDIALVFSNNPETGNFFDVVIVELKKRGISLEENMKTVTQLEKRARKLMKYYKDRIQRIWYYGIIEFNEDVELHLSGEFQELYSSGKMYYKETNVVISKNPDIKLPIGIFIWDIDAVVTDADARNSAFLRLIKSKFLQ
ncbi:MAG: ATP-binding protein [Pusillimonas sp.]